MAIKFEDDKGRAPVPAKKEIGGKTYVAEEPAPKQDEAEMLPFPKPIRPEKKPRKPMR